MHEFAKAPRFDSQRGTPKPFEAQLIAQARRRRMLHAAAILAQRRGAATEGDPGSDEEATRGGAGEEGDIAGERLGRGAREEEEEGADSTRGGGSGGVMGPTEVAAEAAAEALALSQAVMQQRVRRQLEEARTGPKERLERQRAEASLRRERVLAAKEAHEEAKEARVAALTRTSAFLAHQAELRVAEAEAQARAAGWLAALAAVSFAHAAGHRLLAARDAEAQAQRERAAARKIQSALQAWLQRVRDRMRRQAVAVIVRALRRNALRQRARRRSWATMVVLNALSNQREKTRLLTAVRGFKQVRGLGLVGWAGEIPCPTGAGVARACSVGVSLCVVSDFST